MDELREEYEWIEPRSTFLIKYDDYAIWWTFAGKLVNAAMATALSGEAGKVVSDNLSISFSGTVELDSIRTAIRDAVLTDPVKLFVPLEESFVNELKFSECLPQNVKEIELAERYDVTRQLKQLREYPLRSILANE